MLLKLDIAKSFDTVSWEFLLDHLHHLGFEEKWRDCIIVLLSSASTNVNINGHDTQRIRLARGLRQGDPLSPLLFVLVMETFVALCDMVVRRGVLSLLTDNGLTLRASVYGEGNGSCLQPLEELHHPNPVLGGANRGGLRRAWVPSAETTHRLSRSTSLCSQSD